MKLFAVVFNSFKRSIRHIHQVFIHIKFESECQWQEATKCLQAHILVELFQFGCHIHTHSTTKHHSFVCCAFYLNECLSSLLYTNFGYVVHRKTFAKSNKHLPSIPYFELYSQHLFSLLMKIHLKMFTLWWMNFPYRICLKRENRIFADTVLLILWLWNNDLLFN